MKPSAFFLIAAASVFLVACERVNTAKRSDPVSERLSALYAAQDAQYADRYGALDASADIEKGVPKLYRYGMPPEFDREWTDILRVRFGVQVEYIAGCETSPRLSNFADAYNARILEHIAEKYGPLAYREAREEAVLKFQRKKVQPAGHESAGTANPETGRSVNKPGVK